MSDNRKRGFSMSGDEKKISANQEIQKEIAIVDERTIVSFCGEPARADL